MELEGVIHGGAIVPDNPLSLTDGTRVRVKVSPAPEVGDRSRPRHSVLDIAPVSLGSVVSTQSPDDDLLGEMLEGRQ
jgi:hypothetical protein